MVEEGTGVRRRVRTAGGHCRPFGATVHGDSVNFAVFSRHAQRVQLLLFELGGREPIAEIDFDPREHKTGDIWHVLVHGLRVGQTAYGFRVHGPWEPAQGHLFDGQRVLFDPYSVSLSGGEHWGARVPSDNGAPAHGLRRSRIVFHDFDWEGDVPLATPLRDTVIYELHVRGQTIHPSSGVAHPGTFLGLCEKIPYLPELGITAVQLMPALDFDELDQSRTDPSTGRPLLNYWGYSPVSFFAPKTSYAPEPAAAVGEFKEMVRRFHRAGIEVILDVVYNHTCEGNENGPTVCYRGFDNSIYYILDEQGRFFNFSGCGNTLNCNHPLVRDLIIESLRELSYDHKHNDANGESNADGVHDNLGWNCGVEGPTDRADVLALRARQVRNFLLLLLTSQGVPSLLAGDEVGRTQGGNNNAYCQDNETSWVDWRLAVDHADLLRFARMMIALRKSHFALAREEFSKRITWHGSRLGRPDWSGESRALALHMYGWQSRPDVYVIYDAHWNRQRFALPPTRGRYKWQRVVDTALASPDDIVEETAAVWLTPADHYVCTPRSAVALLAWS